MEEKDQRFQEMERQVEEMQARINHRIVQGDEAGMISAQIGLG